MSRVNSPEAIAKRAATAKKYNTPQKKWRAVAAIDKLMSEHRYPNIFEAAKAYGITDASYYAWKKALATDVASPAAAPSVTGRYAVEYGVEIPEPRVDPLRFPFDKLGPPRQKRGKTEYSSFPFPIIEWKTVDRARGRYRVAHRDIKLAMRRMPGGKSGRVFRVK